MTTLLAEVSERAGPKPSREEADRLKQEVRPALPVLALIPSSRRWALFVAAKLRYGRQLSQRDPLGFANGPVCTTSCGRHC